MNPTDAEPSADLLPCPFCGSHDIDPQYALSEVAGVKHASPGCMECDAMADTAESWNRRIPSPDAGTGTRDDWSLIEWQNKERLTVTWNDRHGAFIVQGQRQVCGNMGRGKTVIEALRAARAAKSEGGE